MAEICEVTVRVRGIAVGGAGVGEVIDYFGGGRDLSGIIAFVPFAAPGETVVARVLEVKDKHIKGELTKVIAPSPARVEPRCPYFKICGGCELQQISYPVQLEAKAQMIQGALRAAKLGEETVALVRALKSNSEFGYRRRVTLHVDASGRIGFYRASSRSVVPVDGCVVAVESINRALAGLSGLGKELAGKVSSLQLEADNERLVAVLRAPYDLGADERSRILSAAAVHFSNVVLWAGGREVGGVGAKICSLPLNKSGTLFLRSPAGSFSQIHWEMNRELIEHVLSFAGELSGKTVCDLFAGAGNFSLPLARRGARVTTVEVEEQLVLFMRENFRQFGLEKQLSAIQGSVESFLAKGGSLENYDFIVADPPRSGLGPLVEALPSAPRMMLVYCHLPSLVRDLRLLRDRNWRVLDIQPFDMFPQTSYVETAVVLERGR